MKAYNQMMAMGALALAFSANAGAAIVSVIDSGTDLGHSSLRNNKWVNSADPDDALDNDDNGLIDDTHGWNFADGNNKLYDKKLLGTFSQDVYYFFEVQLRMLRGEATQADLDWIQEHRSNQDFMKELGTFGNWVHGTHVAGIAARDSSEAQVMPLKIIPTKVGAVLTPAILRQLGLRSESKADAREWIAKKALELLADQQGKAMQPIGAYLAAHKPRVANCSFGSSVKALRPVIGPIVEAILGHKLTEDEANAYLSFFLGKVLAKMEPALIASSPKTLFVIAAGNDGTDNDVLPTAPANIKRENTIAVAATMGVEQLASFSNYGATMVEIAAPGVGIKSAIPGETTLTVSGTSQAAPFVANIATRVAEANPALTVAQVKKVVLATVDQKSWLAGKVSTGGTANPDRAVFAAKASLTMPLEQAISQSMTAVTEYKPAGLHAKGETFVLPLPALVQ
jgi:cell wall-associated protease